MIYPETNTNSMKINNFTKKAKICWHSYSRFLYEYIKLFCLFYYFISNNTSPCPWIQPKKRYLWVAQPLLDFNHVLAQVRVFPFSSFCAFYVVPGHFLEHSQILHLRPTFPPVFPNFWGYSDKLLRNKLQIFSPAIRIRNLHPDLRSLGIAALDTIFRSFYQIPSPILWKVPKFAEMHVFRMVFIVHRYVWDN